MGKQEKNSAKAPHLITGSYLLHGVIKFCFLLGRFASQNVELRKKRTLCQRGSKQSEKGPKASISPKRAGDAIACFYCDRYNAT